jgi:cellulose synthase operon protein B
MKRLFSTVSLILLILSVVLLMPGIGAVHAAAPAAVTPTPQVPAAGVQPSSTPQLPPLGSPSDLIPFSMLQITTDTVMRGPYDTMRVRLSTPLNWKLKEGASVRLILSPAFTGTSTTSKAPSGGLLTVSFNGVEVKSLPLDWAGDQTIDIPLPPTAMKSARKDGQHELVLFFDAAKDCDLGYQSSLTVRQSSQFNLPHEQADPILDLTRLPGPVYQANEFEPAAATIVVPNDPAVEELQAAMTAAAGFGRLSTGLLLLNLVTVDQLTPEQRAANHLILVGKPANFAGLLAAPLTLPAPISGSSFNTPGLNPDDGIVQLVASPWNPARVVLLLSGSSDKGVVKAAQAISTGTVRASSLPNLAVVADVQTAIMVPTIQQDRTFTALGAGPLSINGVGASSVEVDFYVPPGQMTDESAYLELFYTHSDLIDYGRSGVTVDLNNDSIGSIRLSDENVKSGNAHIAIPNYALRTGLNRLIFSADLYPLNACLNTTLNNLWVTFGPNSMIHVPLFPAKVDLSTTLNLANYPYNFTSSPTLDTMSFVLPAKDPIAWNTAALLAADIGRRSRGSISEPGVAFADKLDDQTRQNRDLVLVGIPSSLAAINELNPALPAPFEGGSNMATERNMQVVYRLPDGVSIGYLELLAAPWNKDRSVLTVLGSNPEGLNFAAAGLLDPTLRGRLAGNFAAIRNQQVLTSDSRVGVGTGALAATLAPEVPAAVAPLAQVPAVVPVNYSWILPVLIGIGALIVLLLVIGLVSSARASKNR